MRWLVLVLCVMACDGRREFVSDGATDASTDVPGVDAPGVDAPGIDAPGTDAPALPDVPVADGSFPDVPGVDAGPRRGYLDRCTSEAECASSLCVLDTDSTRFCSRSCSAHNQCADEHVCLDGVCVPDDTGETCSVASPDTCNLFCIGTVGGPAHCTRECTSANECPAGFACTRAGGSVGKICVEVEKPCSAAGNECGTTLCIPTHGCTSVCDTAADCPQRGTAFGVTPYTCEFDSGVGSNVCVLPVDIMGGDRIGTFCSAAPPNSCRSGLCADLNETDGIPEQCVQVCNAEGGCPAGMACQPQVLDDLSIHTFCVPAGTGALNATCATGSTCALALCDDPGGYCTRLCGDGLCPTGWACTPVGGGSSLSICRR